MNEGRAILISLNPNLFADFKVIYSCHMLISFRSYQLPNSVTALYFKAKMALAARLSNESMSIRFKFLLRPTSSLLVIGRKASLPFTSLSMALGCGS